jgi:hypothetical protein
MRASRLIRDLQRPDTPADVAERIAHRRAVERLDVERSERFPEITPANAGEMLAWQERRMRELLAE